MPDYCTLAEALSLLPTIGTLRDAATGPPVVTATQPSATQAAALLGATSSEIAMHLRGQGVATPPTDPDALAALQTICMNGTAARIAKAKWPTAASGPGSDGGAAAVLRADYRAGLAFIDAGGLSADTTAAENSVAHGFAAADGTANAPFVTRTTEF